MRIGNKTRSVISFIKRHHGFNKTISNKFEEFKHSCVLKPLLEIAILFGSFILRNQQIKQYELQRDYEIISENCNNNFYWKLGFKIFFKFLEQDNAYRTYWSRLKVGLCSRN